MPVVAANGIELHVQELGEGPPVAMLHGLVVGSVATWFFGAAPALARTHRVLLYDLRGHGRSSRPATGYSVAAQAADLSALLDRFGGGPVALVGHSFGALVALRLALDAPRRVSRLALVEAPLPPSKLGELEALVSRGPAAALEALPAETRVAVARGGRQASKFLAHLEALGKTTLGAELAAERDVSDEALAALRLPTLLVHGTRSPLRAVGARLARAIPGARLIELEGGHFLPSEAPGPLTEALVEFLRG